MLVPVAYSRGMRNRRLVPCGFIALAIWLAAPALAQQPKTAATTRHCLWKVQGQRSTVYLLGSVHVLKPEDYPLPTVMEQAYTNSSLTVFETDMDAMEGLDVQQKIMSKALLPEGETLSGQLSPEVYKKFTNHLADAQLPAFMFERLKPSLAAITLEVAEIQKLGFNPDYGLDKHFFKRAKKEGKKTVPLETLDFQIGLVTEFSKEEGELLMKVMLEDIDKTKSEFPELIRAWRTGDANQLEKLLNEASREAPAIFKRLVSDRNERWIPRIEEWSRGEQNVVVIVGAGHLVGKDGVVELLRKKGLKVLQE